MAATIFRVVNWAPNEVIDEEKVEQINTNIVWLRDNTPRAAYTLPGGLRRVEGLRLVAGRQPFGAKKSGTSTATVNFGTNLFVENCQPLITTGIVSTKQTELFCIINGIGQVQPDNRGFQITVSVDKKGKKRDKFKGCHVTWHALGYYTA